jgi:hypothetical protein
MPGTDISLLVTTCTLCWTTDQAMGCTAETSTTSGTHQVTKLLRTLTSDHQTSNCCGIPYVYSFGVAVINVVTKRSTGGIR